MTSKHLLFNSATCLFSSPVGMPVPSNSMPVMPGQHPASYYTGQPVTGQGVCIRVYVCSIVTRSSDISGSTPWYACSWSTSC